MFFPQNNLTWLDRYLTLLWLLKSKPLLYSMQRLCFLINLVNSNLYGLIILVLLVNRNSIALYLIFTNWYALVWLNQIFLLDLFLINFYVMPELLY